MKQSLFTLAGAKRELARAIKDRDKEAIEFWSKKVIEYESTEEENNAKLLRR